MAKTQSIKPMDVWNEKEAATKIKELYDLVLAQADKTIDWYTEQRKTKARWAKGIRGFAIFFFIGSCIMPYMSSMRKDDVSILYIGYILAGLGGGILLFDKYFGFSSSWIRYVLTGMELESLQITFTERWLVNFVREQPMTLKRFSNLIEMLIGFQQQFDELVKKETEAWAKEFQETQAELVQALKTSGEKIKNQIAAVQQGAGANNDGTVTTDIIAEAINRNDSEWKKTFGVQAIAVGKKMQNGQTTAVDCIVFLPSEKLLKDNNHFIPIPPVISYTSLANKTYDITTDVRPAGGIIKAGNSPALLCDNVTPKRPGCSISREIDKDSSGTLGLKVYQGKQSFILSCYHVLCAPELDAGILKFTAADAMGNTSIVSPSNQDSKNNITIAQVMKGELSVEIDAAIALIEDDVMVAEQICSLDSPPAEALVVTDDHVNERLAVRSIGRTSGFTKGEIVFSNANCDINYLIKGKWQIKTLKGIICTNQSVTGGDSGSVVVDKSNNVIGLIAANSENFAYVVPIQRILSKYSLTLKQT